MILCLEMVTGPTFVRSFIDVVFLAKPLDLCAANLVVWGLTGFLYCPFFSLGRDPWRGYQHKAPCCHCPSIQDGRVIGIFQARLVFLLWNGKRRCQNSVTRCTARVRGRRSSFNRPLSFLYKKQYWNFSSSSSWVYTKDLSNIVFCWNFFLLLNLFSPAEPKQQQKNGYLFGRMTRFLRKMFLNIISY